MKKIYVFINWLSNRKLLNSFIHNWEEYNSEKFTLKLYSQSCSSYPEYWIDDAFSWTDSHEGYDFWEQRHYEWVNFCKKDSNFKETEITISIY